jgi:hypothetical protein
MRLEDETREGVTLFGALGIANSELRLLSDDMLMERLVESGISRLSAARIVAVQRGGVEPGRARRHSQSHRPL